MHRLFCLEFPFEDCLLVSSAKTSRATGEIGWTQGEEGASGVALKRELRVEAASKEVVGSRVYSAHDEMRAIVRGECGLN